MLVIGLGAVIVLSFTQNHNANVTIHPSIPEKSATTSKLKSSGTVQNKPSTPNESHSSSASQPSPTSQNQSLENTGPGSVALLFFGSVFIGITLYRKILIHKQSPGSLK